MWRERMEARAGPVPRPGARAAPRRGPACASATFLKADPEGLAFVPNATTGVSTVLASLRFQPGDELLACDHEYNATLNALRAAAERDGATVVDRRGSRSRSTTRREAVEAYLAGGDAPDAVRARQPRHLAPPPSSCRSTRSSASSTGAAWTRSSTARTPRAWSTSTSARSARRTGPATATSGCARPKGSGLLHVRADLRDRIRPLVVSHGANDDRADRPRFRLEFDWLGTADPTPYLSLPAAIRYIGGIHDDGWAGLMAANRALARRARDVAVRRRSASPAPAPDAMLGSMAAMPLPGIAPTRAAAERLQAELLEEDRIEVPIIAFPVAAATRRRAGPAQLPRPDLRAGLQPARRVRRARRVAREAPAHGVRTAVAARAAPPRLTPTRSAAARRGRAPSSGSARPRPTTSAATSRNGAGRRSSSRRGGRAAAARAEHGRAHVPDDLVDEPRRQERAGDRRARPPRAAIRRRAGRARRAARAARAGPQRPRARGRHSTCGGSPGSGAPSPMTTSVGAAVSATRDPGSRSRLARRARPGAAGGRGRRAGRAR